MNRLSLLLLAGALCAPAGAATITVNATADNAAADGLCTLREALIAANTDLPSGTDSESAGGRLEGECAAGSGSDVIAFAIPGDGPHRIIIGAALPNITQPVTIDGYTQPGATPNSVNALSGFDADIRIILDGGAPASVLRPALRLAAGSSGSTVRGLEITNVTSSTCCRDFGVVVEPLTSDQVIAGNVLHTNKRGGVLVGDLNTLMPSTRVRIGGPLAADRNALFGFPSATAIVIESCQDCTVENNWIGVRPDGAVPNPSNQIGIFVRNASAVTISDNWFGNNTVAMQATGTNDGVVVAHNLFGGGAPNNRAIEVNNIGTQFTVNLDIENNLITRQRSRGIAISSSEPGSGIQDIRLRGNRLFGNGSLEFDLGTSGTGFDGLNSINPNDPGDADTGPNGNQNFPVLGTPSQVGNQLQVPYTLDSPAGSYVIELSFSTQCDGGFNALRGSMPRDPIAIETAQLAGTAMLQPIGAPAAGFLVATATGSEGTSENSACMPYAYSVSPTVFASGFEN